MRDAIADSKTRLDPETDVHEYTHFNHLQEWLPDLVARILDIPGVP